MYQEIQKDPFIRSQRGTKKMGKRSLHASPQGIEQAQEAFQHKGWTQEYLATKVGLETRQSIWKFFKGKSIERHIFINICSSLDLDWHAIADLSLDKVPDCNPSEQLRQKQPIISNVDELLRELRSRLYAPMLEQYTTLRLLDISQPIDLDDIYIDINIFKQLSRQRWLEVSDFQSDKSEKFNHLKLNQISQKKVSAIDVIASYRKLVLMAKPGAGKSTFLQKLALESLRGNLHFSNIPILIKLKDFADTDPHNHWDLLTYIKYKFDALGISEEEVKTLLQEGKVLILLDGLDEVPYQYTHRVIQRIVELSQHYYRNRYIIACRFAAQPYQFPGFTEVEIADFNQTQIEVFAEKWFTKKTARELDQKDLTLANQFIQKLQLPENQGIRELASTPIFLIFLASLFEAKKNFPTNYAQLYGELLNILLVRWDEARGIVRDKAEDSLSLVEKIKLLSYIAARTLAGRNYYFEEREIEQYITDYLKTLPGDNSELETLKLKSKSLLQKLESQSGLLVKQARGIYSFSHVTLQEHLADKNTSNTPNMATECRGLEKLAKQITQPQWGEIFLPRANLLYSNS